MSRIKKNLKLSKNIDATGILIGILASSIYTTGLLPIMVIIIGLFSRIYSYKKRKNTKENFRKKFNIVDRPIPKFIEETELDVEILNDSEEASMKYISTKDTILVNEYVLEKYEKDTIIGMLKHEEGHSKFVSIMILYKIITTITFFIVSFLTGVLVSDLILGLSIIFLTSILWNSLINYFNNINEKMADIYAISQGYKEELFQYYEISNSTKVPSYITLFISNYPSVNQRMCWLSKYLQNEE